MVNTEWDKLTIHIGMPKCASTSLQCNFFANAGCPYVGPVNVHFDFKDGLEAKFKYLLALSTMEEYNYQKHKEKIRSFFHQYFSPEKPGIISDEGITCGYYGAVLEECNDRSVVAKRYAELFPGARILFVIRNQFDFLASLFGEWNRRTFIDFPDVHRWLKDCLELHSNMISNPLCMPDFEQIYRIYSDLFSGRIKVLPLESARLDARGFFDEIAEYMDVEMTDDIFSKLMNRKLNTRVKPFEKKVYSWALAHPAMKDMIPERARKSVQNLIQKFSRELQVEFSDEEKQNIAGLYAPGNKFLMEETSLPLDTLGYPV